MHSVGGCAVLDPGDPSLVLASTGTSCTGPFSTDTGQRGWVDPFPCLRLVLALPGPDSRICQCPASQRHPKVPHREKYAAPLLPACSPSANGLKIYGVTMEENIAVNNSEAQHTFECAVFPTYVTQFYIFYIHYIYICITVLLHLHLGMCMEEMDFKGS